MTRVPKCAICKKPLHGIPKQFPRIIRKLAKSEKRVSRPYGGYLCSKCMRRILIKRIREKFGI